ncbi:hypothetical protein GCM10023201_38780 [Actinomycetospora corticicola]
MHRLVHEQAGCGVPLEVDRRAEGDRTAAQPEQAGPGGHDDDPVEVQPLPEDGREHGPFVAGEAAPGAPADGVTRAEQQPADDIPHPGSLTGGHPTSGS